MFRRFVRYYKPFKGLFILDMICATLTAALDLIFPISSRWYIDNWIPNRNIQMIIIFSCVLFFLYIIKMIASYIMSYYGHLLGTYMEGDMRKDLFIHIQQMPFSYFDNMRTGQLMSRIVGDLREVSEMAHHGPEDLFISMIMIIGSFIILMTINPLITGIIFIIVFLLIIFSLAKRTKLVTTFRGVRESHAKINARIESSISGIRSTKSYTNESYEIDKFLEKNMEYVESYRKSYKHLGEFSAGNNFLMDLLSLAAIFTGALFVYNGTILYGELVAYLLYVAYFITPIRRLIQFTQIFQSGYAGFKRFHDLMETKSDMLEKEDAVDLTYPKGKIEFSNVSFRYNEEGEDSWILNDFNIEIEPGMKIGIVGTSGVGKTTLVHLIPRFYDVKEGNGIIFIDDINIKDLKLESLRKNIGIVYQDVFIFYGTIRENIEFGKPGATDEEIIRAAKSAKLHDFIMTLPEGYDTIVGERGIKLSGGQKQRLAIAQVFLKNPPILILDEATSSLDSHTEIEIQKSFDDLSKGRTTIAVAHRLSTIKNAHEILVMTKKGIAERGTHEELMQLPNGIYRKLYNAQSSGYIPDDLNGN
ncbi:MAG: ABC transporter ATP-binding protein [Candidatus Lokiarchaeota archaeon]|nr:ABC transporter ATP-binding protein [Candidatus Lokiarchaeota archaeon]